MTERTLVVAPNWVGDNVMALPTLRALADSGRELVVLARGHLGPLLAMVDSISEFLPRDPSTRQTIQDLGAARCSEAVILPNSFRSAWLPYRAGISSRWGYKGDFRSLILSRPVATPGKQKRHQVEDYAALLEAMKVPPPETWVPSLALDPAIEETGRERLDSARLLAGSGPLVGIFPGAEFGPSKRWSWKSFASLARELRKAQPDLRQIILAGPKEVWIGVRVHEESARMHPVIGPELDLAQLAGVVAQLDVLVTNDSGPMHLAAALGVPCIAVFGPTDPVRTGPAGAGHQIHYTDRWCSPCFRKRCPLIHHRCMRDITVDSVRDSVLDVLRASR